MGTTGVANSDVRQLVEVVADDAAKMRWLLARVPEFVDEGGLGAETTLSHCT